MIVLGIVSAHNVLSVVTVYCVNEFIRDANAGLVGAAYLARVALTEHNDKVTSMVRKTMEDEKAEISRAASSLNEYILFSIPVLAIAYVGFVVYTRRR